MVLDDLIQLIKSRKNGDTDKSYTARLFNQGLEECCKKFGEESVDDSLEMSASLFWVDGVSSLLLEAPNEIMDFLFVRVIG